MVWKITSALSATIMRRTKYVISEKVQNKKSWQLRLHPALYPSGLLCKEYVCVQLQSRCSFVASCVAYCFANTARRYLCSPAQSGPNITNIVVTLDFSDTWQLRDNCGSQGCTAKSPTREDRCSRMRMKIGDESRNFRILAMDRCDWIAARATRTCGHNNAKQCTTCALIIFLSIK